MNCPNCQANNPESAQFCSNCGQHLSRSCPNCQHSNPPGANFCNNCGNSLKDLPSLEPKKDPDSILERLIPSGLASKLQAATHGKTLAGERRIVTILFCDVQGSTSASQDMDPEEWAEIMNGVFEQMITPVYRYEGFVARLMGDSILAFFGAPIAHEDDPQRAVLAGLDITRAVVAYSEQLNRERGLRLSVRVGINTGLVVVGTVGSDLRMEYTAMGDAINLAARMEQTAQPGSVQITAETQKLVAPHFHSEDLGFMEIKGKNEPIQVFNVTGHRSGDLARTFDDQVSPLVGRENELRAIEHSFEDLQRGLGGILYLSGEAGIGKSRLVSEIKSRMLASGTIAWFEASNLSYESGQPYASFKRLMREMMAISPEEDHLLQEEKIVKFLHSSGLDETEQYLQVLRTLFGIDGQVGQPTLEGEGFRGMLFASSLAYWHQQASNEPVVLVFEDLQWSDPASVGLMERLFSLVDQVPILFICAIRPERESAGWKSMLAAESNFPHRFTRIELLPLTMEHSAQLVDQLIDNPDFPASMRSRILQKADGNPYFVEEVVHSLVDQGFISSPGSGNFIETSGMPGDIEIPDNLQSLLHARLDNLDENSRWILQVAAVIGRTFNYKILSRLVDIPEDLDQHLVDLQRQQLIQEASRLPELEYVFKHVMIQEAAYSTLLIREKKHYHGLVARTLEEIYPERAAEYAPLLAHHYQMADDPLRALNYYRIAGDEAFRLFAVSQASDHYSKALQILLSNDQDFWQSSGESREELLEHLYLRKGRALELNQQFDMAVSNYTALLDYSLEVGSLPLELAAQIAMLTLHSIPGPYFDVSKANTVAERALTLSATIEDHVAEAKVYWGLTMLNVMSRNTTTAIGYAEKSIKISRELMLEEQLAYSLNDLARAYLALGEFEQAQTVADEAYVLFEKLGDRPMLGDNTLNSAEINLTLGNYQKAYEQYLEITKIASSIDNSWLRSWGLNGMGYINLEFGHISQGIEMLVEVIAITDKIGIEMLAAGTRSQLALVYADLGDYSAANKMAEKALLIAGSDTFPDYFRTYPYSAAARVFCIQGDLERAEPLLKESLKHYRPEDYIIIFLKQVSFSNAEFSIANQKYVEAIDEMDDLVIQLREKEALSLLAQPLRIKGEAQLLNNQPEQALLTLLEAKSASEQLGERRQYWMILAGLAEIEENNGNAEAAEQYWLLAKETIEYIAEHILDPDQRGKFLNLPRVTQVINF
jgi:class 3 adenylate cyclase/tetratricopeptide (TPR) repeat protein